MNDLETIDNYFAGRLTATEKARFEQQIVADSELAEAVAFYLQARQAARAEVLTRKKTEWETLRKREGQRTKLAWAPMAYVAAASVLLLLGVFLFWPKQSSVGQLADQYIHQHLTTLSVTMGSQPDTLQLARQAYNEERFAEAETLVLALQKRDTTNAESLKLAGLVSLRQGNYDKAIEQFHRLSQRVDLYTNPGLFYEALTRLKRAQPTDEASARQLLQTVIQQKLEGQKAAEELMKNF